MPPIRMAPLRPPSPPRGRAPRPPAPPSRAPQLTPLRLAPIRSRESLALDQGATRAGAALPPFVRWDAFLRDYFRWEVGQHLITIGPTGSGKTVLNRELLRHAPIPWVVVFGVKRRDPELYGAFEKDGYELVRSFDAHPPPDADHAHVLFVPRSEKEGQDRRNEMSQAFRRAIHDILQAGGWVTYFDDVIVMSRQFGLRVELDDLWIRGRSEEISVVASAQEPVNIPPVAYGSSSHLFIFKNPDMYRTRRLGELTGFNRDLAFETVLRLPPHEFLYVNKDTGLMLRSKVLR